MLKFDKYDVALIADEKQRLYFTGFSSSDGYLVIEKTSISFVVDDRYFCAAEKLLVKRGVKVIKGNDYSYFHDLAARKGYKKAGVDFTKVFLSGFKKLEESGLEFVDISEEIAEISSVKTEEEIKKISKACKIAEKSWKEVLPLIREGITERELAAELEYRFLKNGAQKTSFDTIIAFGKNAAVPHHETGNARLKEGQCVLMDFGCVYKGYCSDMTRTLFFGAPSARFIKAYEAVLKAHKAAADFIRAGTSGKDADGVARKSLEKDGCGKYFTHSLGHGVGVNIHEFPVLSPKSKWILRENSVFTNEPGVYIDGAFGIRIEDTAAIIDGKYKSFMKNDKSLITIC